jgi:hypothetical protein
MLKAYHSSNREPTRRTETSKYPQEKKITMIPRVVASEKGRAQTRVACCLGVVGPHLETLIKSKLLERGIIEGESPVDTN